jgi:hypothetical protein
MSTLRPELHRCSSPIVAAEGADRTRTGVDGFAGRCLTTRPPRPAATPNPTGLCRCGCGQPTPLAKKTDRRHAHVKGQPVSYLPGHQTRYNELPVDKLDLGYETPCLVWLGAVNSKGYPIRVDGGQGVLVHRQVYEAEHGPIPAGHDVHHRCYVRRCVRGSHLEALTRRDHNRHHAALRSAA